MSDAIVMEVYARDKKGKMGARATRRSHQAPAVLYGAGKPSECIAVDQNLVNRLAAKVAFHTQVIELTLPSGKKEQAIVKQIQYHPLKSYVRHVDFCRISQKKAMRLAIPIHCLGEDVCVGVKEEGGTLMQHKHEVEVECLPGDLPNALEIDVSALAMDQTYHMSDLVLPKGVALVDPPHDDHNHPLVSVHAAKMKEEEEEVVASDEAESGGEAEGASSDEAADRADSSSEEKPASDSDGDA